MLQFTLWTICFLCLCIHGLHSSDGSAFRSKVAFKWNQDNQMPFESKAGRQQFVMWCIHVINFPNFQKKTQKCKQRVASFRTTNVNFRRDFIATVGQVDFFFLIQAVDNTTWPNTIMWKVYGLALCPWTAHPLFPIQSKWMKSTVWMQREMYTMIWVRSQPKMFVQKNQLSE